MVADRGTNWTAVQAPLNLSTASATNNGSLYRGWSGKAVGSGHISGGIMSQSRPLAAASAALVCGSIASASGVVVQIAGHEGDGKSVIASVPLTISTTLSTIVLAPFACRERHDTLHDRLVAFARYERPR